VGAAGLGPGYLEEQRGLAARALQGRQIRLRRPTHFEVKTFFGPFVVPKVENRDAASFRQAEEVERFGLNICSAGRSVMENVCPSLDIIFETFQDAPPIIATEALCFAFSADLIRRDAS
jgi:hypothetical protein